MLGTASLGLPTYQHHLEDVTQVMPGASGCPTHPLAQCSATQDPPTPEHG